MYGLGDKLLSGPALAQYQHVAEALRRPLGIFYRLGELLGAADEAAEGVDSLGLAGLLRRLAGHEEYLVAAAVHVLPVDCIGVVPARCAVQQQRGAEVLLGAVLELGQLRHLRHET